MKNPIIIYYDSGKVWIKEWYLNDQLHRTDGPAVIEYFHSGEVWIKEWYLNGEQHRTDGPASISNYQTGEIVYEWYLNDKEIYPENWLQENGYEWPLTDDQQTELLLMFA